MAAELCPAETNVPSFSFSHDFCSSSSTIFPVQKNCCPLPSTSSSFLLNSSNVDFEFDVRIDNIDEECYSSADELFCNGKMLPLQIKKMVTSPSKQDHEHEHPPPQKPQPRSSKDVKVAIGEEVMRNQNQSDSKSSFWQFKRRSSSLNSVTGYKRIFYSSSTLLSRSSSAGSAPKVKPGPVFKDGKKEKSSPFLQSSTSNPKSNLKKSSAYGSHCTINPVLNVPLVDIICVSSVFLTGRGKKKG